VAVSQLIQKPGSVLIGHLRKLVDYIAIDLKGGFEGTDSANNGL
jgi:hypothetical protein